MDLYSAMFTRKSTRKFLPEALGADELVGIKEFIAGVAPLVPSSNFSHRIVGPDAVKGLAIPDAPHFILISGPKQPLRNTCAGFLFQHLDLYLFSQGLAARWLGMVKPREKDPAFIIGIAFGKPAEPAVRTLAEFDRKPLSEIASGYDPRLEAARLAPSGVNGQPWYFIVDDDGEIHTYCKEQLGGLLGMAYKLTDLDVGIALCHLKVASEHEGKPFNFRTDLTMVPPAPKGFRYLGTVTNAVANASRLDNGEVGVKVD